MQDVAAALDKFGFFKGIARKATDLANKFDVWLKGKGKKTGRGFSTMPVKLKGKGCHYCHEEGRH